MSKTPPHKWQFAARFRRHSFGWKSQPAITRLKQALSEIKKLAKQDPFLAAEGAVLLLQKLSPALEQVDSSSGAIGSKVNQAIETLVPIIAKAPASEKQREAWMQKLWQALEDDGIPYIEHLGSQWGELCASKPLAEKQADQLLMPTRLYFGAAKGQGHFFKGTEACLSSLLAAGRHAEILELLELKPRVIWDYAAFGVRALAAQGKVEEAIAFALAQGDLHQDSILLNLACEGILLESGAHEQAYARFGLAANKASTYLTWFRAVCKKYPHLTPGTILQDLVDHTPGEEGKWFASAKSAGLFGEALALAERSPTDPRTLIRAARDFVQTNPEFALGSGMCALHWLNLGHGYEITELDAQEALQYTLAAAATLGRTRATHLRLLDMLGSGSADEDHLRNSLQRLAKIRSDILG